MNTSPLSAEQSLMEKRFSVPYNWCRGSHTRNFRQKNGLWAIVSEMVGNFQGKTVLDAGCGDGWYSARMVSAGAVVSGADYSERAIRFAEAIVPDASFVEASITALPYGNNMFDITCSFQVIEHLPPDEVASAVSEMVRVTKPGGMIVVSVPSIQRPISAAHYQHFTESSLRAYFAQFSSDITVVGQDRHTSTLSILERMLENRVYTLERLGSKFNHGYYLRHFNKASVSEGYNLILMARKR